MNELTLESLAKRVEAIETALAKSNGVQHFAEPVESDEQFAKRFADLVARCYRDTAHSSKIKTKMEHPAFLEIVAMGDKALPLLLAELERTPTRWTPLLALEEITHADPCPEDNAAWVAWGREQGYKVAT